MVQISHRKKGMYSKYRLSVRWSQGTSHCVTKLFGFFFFFTINIVYGRRKWDVDLLEKPGRAFSLALIRWQTEAGVSCFPCRGDSDIHVYSWQELLVFWGRGFMMFFESYCSVMGLAPPVYSCVESHVLEKQERVNGVRDASVVPSEDKWVTCRFHSHYTIFITVKTEY